jgi:adenylosuccinate lyase
MLNRLKGILQGLRIYPERMKMNMERSFGLFNSQRVMLALVEKGMTREDAYAVVQKNAMESWAKGVAFMDLLLADREIRATLNEDEIRGIFDVDFYLRHVDFLFKRVFGR